jgi:hypothetical protein
VSYRTPLARVPFPRVRGTKAQAAALKHAIGQLPLELHPRVRSKPGERGVSGVAQRAVLEAIATHVNGAGFCLLTVATIAHEGGVAARTVFRALIALEAQGHLERHFFRRTRDRYRHDGLLPVARRGQGPNIYRVGAALRARAGFREVEWTPDTPARTAGRTTQLVAAPDGGSGERPAPSQPVNGGGSPRHGAAVGADMQGKHMPPAAARGTPRTKNERRPLSKEERLVLSTSKSVLSSRDATIREAPLRNTSELVSLLPLHEALIVMEAEAFVDAGRATWVEPGWSA